MVKLTAWTKFLTDYHKKSGNAKLSKSMKEASKLYKKHNGKTGKHGRKRGGDSEVEPLATEVAQPATEPIVEPLATEPIVVPAAEEKVEELVAPTTEEKTAGGRSKKRKGSKKSKTRRR